jgi:hypothetical protein
MQLDRVKGFAALVTRHLKIEVILACHMSKLFMAGTTAPLQTPQTEGGASPFWQPPDVSFNGGPRRKNGHFLSNISQTKNSIWGLNRTFFSLFEVSKGGGRKAVKTHLYEGKS